MRAVAQCPVCASPDLSAVRAATTPFLARRIWNRPPFEIQLASCRRCSFTFYNPRLEEAEEKALYNSYRGESYQRERQSFEPWYTEEFNARLFAEVTICERRARIKHILESERDFSDATILDFGGARGEVARELFPGCNVFVYDVSNVEPLSGVQPCVTLEQCLSHEFDVVICSNVLEHVAEPCDTLADISKLASSDTLIFIEVPVESPFRPTSLLRRIVCQLALLLKRPHVWWSLAAIPSLHQMHEHVNFFDVVVLNRLASEAGLQVQKTGKYDLGVGISHATMAYCLAKR